MKISFYLAFKNLFAHKKLFFLVISIIILSFINLTFFNSLNNGIREVTNEKLVDYTYADLQILPKDGELYITNTPEILNKLRNINGIAAVTPRLRSNGVMIDKDDNGFMPVIIGIDVRNEYYVSKLDSAVKKGNYMSSNFNGGLVLGDEIVGNLDGSKGTTGFETLNLEVGDEFKIAYSNGVNKNYKVQGIMDTLFWIPDFYLLVPIEELRNVLNYSEDISSEILIKIEPNANKEDIQKTIINSGINLRVKNSIEEFGLTDTILKSQEVTLILVNIISIFSTFIIIFIMIYINVNNKKRELAIQRAIGINENEIIKSYIYLSLIYSIIGIILGIIFLNLINQYLTLNPIKLPMGYFSPKFEILVAIKSSIIIIISAIVASFFATYKIIKTNITDVLRGN